MMAAQGLETDAELELKVGELEHSREEVEESRVLLETEVRAKTALEEEVQDLHRELEDEKAALGDEIQRGEEREETVVRLEGELEEMQESMAELS